MARHRHTPACPTCGATIKAGECQGCGGGTNFTLTEHWGTLADPGKTPNIPAFFRRAFKHFGSANAFADAWCDAWTEATKPRRASAGLALIRLLRWYETRAAQSVAPGDMSDKNLDDAWLALRQDAMAELLHDNPDAAAKVASQCGFLLAPKDEPHDP
jgi:hypothetical protein